jgi:hypothetical protein
MVQEGFRIEGESKTRHLHQDLARSFNVEASFLEVLAKYFAE